MKSQDIMNENNERGRVLQLLRDFCADNDLEYSYKEKEFKVKLPTTDPLPTEIEKSKLQPTKRKRFDISKWGPKGPKEGTDDIDDNFPDELPPTTTPLEEGKPPKGDDEK